MTIQTLEWDETPPPACRGGAVAIGNFDGVHRGHTALLGELCSQARRVGGPSVAVTFDPPPRQLLRPQQAQPALTTADRRAGLIRQLGVEHVVIVRTTPELLRLSAEEFFERVVRRGLDARALVEGPDFGFGRRREGTIETLATLCRRDGLGLKVVPPLVHDGQVVSSSRIRAALLAGAPRAAELLLGRPYRLAGVVGVGQRRGRTLGFPTANLERIVTLLPAEGVYAVRVFLDDAARPGAANLGPNPTFQEQARKVEVHVIGYEGDLYGRGLEVEFVERLRDTRPFASAADLVQQLRADVEQARSLAG